LEGKITVNEYCENIDKCPMFEKFEGEAIFKFWIKNYCKGKHAKCVRKELKNAGKEVPINLLPNGTLLTRFTNQL